MGRCPRPRWGAYSAPQTPSWIGLTSLAETTLKGVLRTPLTSNTDANLLSVKVETGRGDEVALPNKPAGIPDVEALRLQPPGVGHLLVSSNHRWMKLQLAMAKGVCQLDLKGGV